jgi:alpha-tubulin suppressor-like RCC1 family protein
VQVEANGYCSLYLLENGTVFLSGLHVYPDMKHDLTPKLVEGLKGRRVVQVASGFTHVMFLTDDGAVLSCGLGEYGQLGHGDEETKLKPKLVAALEGRLITNIATTTSVAMFVENNGKVHACGDARGGRTGTGPVTAWEIHTPKQVIL